MSTPQFSLIVFAAAHDPGPVSAGGGHALFLRDIESFFKKFSIEYEILWLPDSARSVARFLSLCEQAQAPLLVTLNESLSSPLGDVLKLLQHLVQDPALAAAFGSRWRKQPEIAGHSLYTRILRDRGSQVLSDPLCEYFAFRKSLLGTWLPGLLDGASSSPFITAHAQRAVLRMRAPFVEVDIHNLAPPAGGWRQTWRRIWFVMRF